MSDLLTRAEYAAIADAINFPRSAFIDGGFRWIIDYKYAAPNINESEQNFYQRQIETYSPQLNHYAQLYQKLETKKVRCALYFPQTAVFIELTGD